MNHYLTIYDQPFIPRKELSHLFMDEGGMDEIINLNLLNDALDIRVSKNFINLLYTGGDSFITKNLAFDGEKVFSRNCISRPQASELIHYLKSNMVKYGDRDVILFNSIWLEDDPRQLIDFLGYYVELGFEEALIVISD